MPLPSGIFSNNYLLLLLFVNPQMSNSDFLQILLWLIPDYFIHQRETPWALKGLKLHVLFMMNVNACSAYTLTLFYIDDSQRSMFICINFVIWYLLTHLNWTLISLKRNILGLSFVVFYKRRQQSFEIRNANKVDVCLLMLLLLL